MKENPKIEYKFSNDDENGKVNVEKFFKERNQYEKIDNYY